jgi:hypothetical protein
VTRRRGRWTYVSDPHEGPIWRLDDSDLFLEYDDKSHACCIGGPRCRGGAWIWYLDYQYQEPVASDLLTAMEWAEEHWDADHPKAGAT